MLSCVGKQDKIEEEAVSIKRRISEIKEDFVQVIIKRKCGFWERWKVHVGLDNLAAVVDE